MTDLDRRQLLAGAATATVLTAATATGAIAADAPDLSGKSVLITGCSSGFGRLAALHFAELGAKVIATMRGLPRPEGDSLLAEAKDRGLDIHLVQIDVLSDDQVTAGVAEAEAIAGGAIDILVNNAGIGITGPIELQDSKATQLIFETNVLGYHRTARAVLPKMREAGSGQIFAISSQLGRVIVPSSGHYSPTKFAVEAMFEALAYELVPHGIDVTIIQPGGYPTQIWVNRNAYTSALRDRLPEARKAGYPALVAQMGKEDGSGRSADPMDVPRAMAEIVAMPPGQRPLRRAVHPGPKPQQPINDLAAKVQTDWLGGSAYGPWVKDVHNAG